MKKTIIFIAITLLFAGALIYAQSSTPFTPPWSYTGTNASTSTLLNAMQPYKKIVTRITQTSTSTPVDTTLEDNQATAHTMHRITVGDYRIRCNDCFSTTKTVVFSGNTVADANIRAWVIDTDSIGIQVADSSAVLRDAKLTNTPFEIRMYP